MLLAGSDGQRLEIALHGYRVRHGPSDDYYFLTVEGHVVHARGSWTFSNPCLLTEEARSLAEWLDAVTQRGSYVRKLEFTEPNLRFLVLNSPMPRTLRVYFELEARPPWAPSRVAGEDDLWVEFAVAELDLESAAASIRRQIESLPAWPA